MSGVRTIRADGNPVAVLGHRPRGRHAAERSQTRAAHHRELDAWLVDHGPALACSCRDCRYRPRHRAP